MTGARPTVVKLGGSLASAPQLRAWLDAIAGLGGSLVVPGGGAFAEAVRVAQPRMGFDDSAAHRMALLAMEQYAHALASLDRRFVPAASLQAIAAALAAKSVPLWLPSKMVLRATDIPCSWDVTSDSLAAWLSRRLRSRVLVLVKARVVPGRPAAAQLAQRGIVDPCFPDLLAASGAELLLTGPDDHPVLAARLQRTLAGAASGEAPARPLR